jgi:hypothetical protein
MAHDISDEDVRAQLDQEARETVRHIRAGTVTYDTEDYATAAVLRLIDKREFQVTRELARRIAGKIIEYPTDEYQWPEHLIAELAEMCAQLIGSHGEVEGR